MSLVQTTLVPLINLPREATKRLHNLLRGVRDICPEEAHRRLQDGAVLLDVREPDEYAAGHVSGSLLIPLGSLGDRVDEIAHLRLETLVILCHGGKRSATACARLAELGFPDTLNVAGGILAWRKAGLPEVRRGA